MAFMDQTKKAVIQAALKPVLAQYGMKGSLSVRSHMTIVLTLTKGPIDFIPAFKSWGPSGQHQAYEKYYLPINTYWIDENYTGTAGQFLKDCMVALRAADWYDKSDASIDFFSTAYYIEIQVGKWSKPYILTA